METILRKIRLAFAAIIFILITLLFLDITGALYNWFGLLAKIQFLPAILSLNFIVIVVLAIATLILGRVYCSVICPLGILQDIIAWFRFKLNKKARYHWSKEKKWLRYGIFVVFIFALIIGFQSFVAIVAPYSSYGRIVENLFSPIYILGNNLFALITEKAGSYTIYPKEVWLKSLPTFIIAAITFIALIILAWKGGRTYCNTICPVGTTLSFLARFSAFRPVIDRSKCKLCHKCEKDCKSSCIDLEHYKVDYSRCVTCFNCISSCKFDAMQYRFAWGKSVDDNLNTTNESSKFRPLKSQTLSKQDKAGTDVSRRAFIVSSAIVLSSLAIGENKEKVKKTYAKISGKKVPERSIPITPAGSWSVNSFYSHCTACQLCVIACPNNVLRPSSKLSRIMQPEMSYERGFCKPDCVKCSELCPTGAIRRILPEEKKSIHIGMAEIEYSLCLAAEKGAKCGLCARNCPIEAISMIEKEITNTSGNKKTVKIPMVNESKCIGCGACEFVCPSRPLSAIKVNGREIHLHSDAKDN